MTAAVNAIISIPVWCDWETSAIIDSISCSEFQFQYGAIESKIAAINAIQAKIFQFQFGAIES